MMTDDMIRSMKEQMTPSDAGHYLRGIGQERL